MADSLLEGEHLLEEAQSPTVFSASVVLEGELTFGYRVDLYGSFRGRIQSAEGTLFVAQGARLEAEVSVGRLLLEGELHGDVYASEELVLRRGSALYGNVRSSKLSIDDGVIFEGECSMIRGRDSLDIFSASVAQIKSSLQNEE